MSAKHVLHGDGFSLELEQHHGYLRAYVFGGVDSLAVSIAYYRLLGAECARRGADRVLIVEDLRDEAPFGDTAALIEAGIEAGFDRIRCAFVDLRGGHEFNARAELDCLMQGVTLMVFVNEEQARSWLLYGDESEAVAG